MSEHLAGNHGGFFGCGCCGGGTHQRKAASLFSRRRFLGTGLVGVMAATTLGVALPEHARAQNTRSPDEALQTLLEGNKRLIEKRLTSFDEDLAILRQNTEAKQ